MSMPISIQVPPGTWRYARSHAEPEPVVVLAMVVREAGDAAVIRRRTGELAVVRICDIVHEPHEPTAAAGAMMQTCVDLAQKEQQLADALEQACDSLEALSRRTAETVSARVAQDIMEIVELARASMGAAR